MSEQDRLSAALEGRYTIERELGAGGMATVYLAHDQRHQRKVALKVLRPELSAVLGAERFLAEIRTTANLQHPHILPLFDSGTGAPGHGGTEFVYYAMPFVEGETLRDRLTREKQLPVDESVRIAREVAGALDYAHRHGVVHRDIKPENILLHDGTALVADFGIALAASSAGGTRMTETGMSLGTPHYMSPEQAMGEREITARSDVYALGCVLYEMLSGEPPFTGPTAQAIIARVVTEEPRSLTLQRKTVPPHVEAAVVTALQKLPADRFASAADFGAALANEGPRDRGTVGRTRGGSLGSSVPRSSGPSLVPWALCAVLAVVAAVALARGRDGSDGAVPTRFTVDMGPGQSFAGGSTHVVISPDGRRIVVRGIADRRFEIFTRSLDRLEVAAVTGGTGGNRPFLSPDGRWIAFSAGGKLRKIPVEGGVAVDLSDSHWGAGTWSDDGRLVFTPTYQSGLSIVSEAGGDARVLTRPDSASGELGHWWAQFLPGNRRVLFTVFRTPYERATVEVLDLDSGERTVLLSNALFGRYVPTGHLLFARDNNVLAVAFDARRLAVRGSPVPVIEDVARNTADGHAAFDVSPAGTLAYIPNEALGSERTVVLVDRRGAERTALATPQRYEEPRLSPDGRRVAVSLYPAAGAPDVWVFEVGRESGTRLTTSSSSDFGAQWSADGREVFYMSEQPLFELWRRPADASRPPRRLAGGRHDHITGAASADGRLLAFVMSVPQPELWTMALDGTDSATRYLASDFEMAHPAPSPDGRWMAYASDESGRSEVYVRSFPDPAVVRHQVSHGGGSEPLWTRGGRELVFRRGDTVLAVSVNPATGTPGAPAVLFAGPYIDNPAWAAPRTWDASRDGERFLLLKRPPAARPRVVVVQNWFTELRQKVPN